LHGSLDCGAHLWELSDVTGQIQRFTTRAHDFRNDTCAELVLHIQENDGSALLSKQPRRRRADAVRRTGDHAPLSVKPTLFHLATLLDRASLHHHDTPLQP
jgi:hypothetical protein